MGLRHIISPVADVYGTPDTSAQRGKLETQLVFGESFDVTSEKDGWCQGICTHDGYAGFVESRHLAPAPHLTTHIVTTARSHCYADATIKSPFVRTLGFGSAIGITAEENGFARMADGTWVYTKHITPLPARLDDYVTTAHTFIETPYYWGGRSGFGIDCSGLVQVVLSRAGIKAPRDSGDQEQAIGTTVEKAQRGDIVFFPGHVGIMTDDKHLIHANAFHMKVTIEPLTNVVTRGSAITSIKRILS